LSFSLQRCTQSRAREISRPPHSGFIDPAAAKKLNVRSIAFKSNSSAVLNFRNDEVDMGFFYGLNLVQAMNAFEQMATAVEKTKDNYVYYSKFYRLVPRLLLRMNANSKNFPEGEAFKKLTTDADRREFLNRELAKLQFFPVGFPEISTGPGFHVGVALGGPTGGKVDIRDLWSENVNRGVPIEAGYFGSVHGIYSHALQLIAMLKGAPAKEVHAFQELINNTSPLRFEFFLGLAVDSRSGDVNDPSWWRQHYEPRLP
jgi:hypothetical protein